jgi:F-type H+-transporting ATPase subunit a
MTELHPPSLAPDHLFSIGGWPIANSVLGTWLGIILLLAFLAAATARPSLVPKPAQNALEFTIEGIRDLVSSVMDSEKLTRRYLPLVVAIFLFVLFVNWVSLLPGFGTVGAHDATGRFVPFLRAGSSDLNLTFAMAGVAFLVAQVSGVVLIGLFKYFNKFVNIGSLFQRPFSWKNVALFVPLLLLSLVELISEIAKFVALSFRLFGNLYAGEVLLVVFGTLLPVFIPLSGPFYLLEVFVGLIQAFVFAMLTIVFIKIASLTTEH